MKLGIDVVPVARIAAAVERYGDRFLKRVYTPAELKYAKGNIEKLAGRWAAKEAVLKALGGRGRFPRMSLVEVLPGRRGAPEVKLTREPTPNISVSITHDGGMAMAVAAVVEDTARRPRPRIPPELRLPNRPEDANKGTFGQVVVVAGSLGYTGAPFLTATAAARTGAGYVRLLAAETIYPILAMKCAEVVVTQVPEVAPGTLGHAGLEPLQRYCSTADACVIGPGLGREYSTRRLVIDLLGQLRSPAVVDADALNALSEQRKVLSRLRASLVLTPHPMEMSRLTGIKVEEIQADREGVAARFAQEWGQVVVLKGAHTVIASPDGNVRVNPHSNPALASAGTGDVLAGIIGGLLAQGLEPFEAAVTGVFLHGAAGEEATARLGDAGVMASDLLPLIPVTIRDLKPLLKRTRA
ncbi:MAG: NAD(P)H-hydrate dehydratase [Candidatus Dormibacteraeota bacterium]|nr:NAD(P)H-hydrate dehydratase [Candidatus Dormibacteraeota bacterium]